MSKFVLNPLVASSLKRGKSLREQFRKSMKARKIDHARIYLERNGLIGLLTEGDRDEIRPDIFDMYHLHSIVRQRKPQTVLEFGTGFSTLVMAHALRENHLETNGGDLNKQTKVWSIDANLRWIKNLETKIKPELKDYITLRHSKVEVREYQRELCHVYTKLPNIIPDFIYLDGPDPGDVERLSSS